MPEKGRACPTGLWGCQEEARASQSVQGLRSLSKGGLGLLEDSISLLRGPVPSWRGSELSELGASSVSCSSNFFFSTPRRVPGTGLWKLGWLLTREPAGSKRPGELNVTGEISQAGCEGDDLYLSPEMQRGRRMRIATVCIVGRHLQLHCPEPPAVCIVRSCPPEAPV